MPASSFPVAHGSVFPRRQRKLCRAEKGLCLATALSEHGQCHWSICSYIARDLLDTDGDETPAAVEKWKSVSRLWPATIWFSMRRWLSGQEMWKYELFNPVLWRDLSSRRGEVVAELSSQGHLLELGAFALMSHLHLGVGVGNRDHAGTDWEKLTLTSVQNWWIWWGW